MVSPDARDELPPRFAQVLCSPPAPPPPAPAPPAPAAAHSPARSPSAPRRDGGYQVEARSPVDVGHDLKYNIKIVLVSLGALGGSYTNLFESGEPARHAYMNHSLDLDPVPLQGESVAERRRTPREVNELTISCRLQRCASAEWARAAARWRAAAR